MFDGLDIDVPFNSIYLFNCKTYTNIYNQRLHGISNVSLMQRMHVLIGNEYQLDKVCSERSGFKEIIVSPETIKVF